MIKLFKGRRGSSSLERLKNHAFESKAERDALLEEVNGLAGLKLDDVGWMVLDRDVAIRAAGSRLVRDTRDPSAVEFFIKRWHDTLPVARQVVGRSFSRLVIKGWEQHLKRFLNHKNDKWRTAALQVLFQCEMTDRIRELLIAHLQHSNEKIRNQSLRRLLDSPERVPTGLLLTHIDHPHEDIRSRIVDALASTLDAGYLEHFAARIEVEIYSIQQQLVGAFVRYAEAGHDVTTQILPLLSGGDPALRQMAVKILTQMPDQTRVVREFITYSKTLSGWVRRRALESMSEFGNVLLQPVIELLGDEKPAIRSSAILMANWVNPDPSLERAIFPLLDEQDWWARLNAAETLGQIGSPISVPYLVELLNDPDARWGALDALARIKDPRTLQPVLGLLENPEPEVRVEVVKVLDAFGSDAVVDHLKHLCKTDESLEVRDEAYRVLRRLLKEAPDQDADAEDEELRRFVDFRSGYDVADLPDIVRILLVGRERQASDIHIASGKPPLIRVRGVLTPVEGEPVLEAGQSLAYVRPILSPIEEQTLRDRGSTEVLYVIPEQGRYRGSIFVDRNGINAVFRVIPNRVPTLTDIGLPSHLSICGAWHQGLILVVGPSGSGKTTTLAALVNLINETRQVHILTIEDPVEYVHHYKNSLVNQRQVERDTVDYHAALRGALREDPDVIVIGEMRDSETVQMALEAAETGHLVIGTLNGTNAPRAVDRVINSFPPDQQSQIRLLVADTLKVVIAQSLLPRADGEGRVALFEVLMGLPTVGAVIRENRTMLLPSLMQMGRTLGMRTADDSLMELVERGLVEPEVAYDRASDKERFESLLSESALSGDLA